MGVTGCSMAFEILLRNGYTGETARVRVSENDTISQLVDRAERIWGLLPVQHTALVENRVLEPSLRLSEAHVGRSSTLEIIPIPRMSR